MVETQNSKLKTQKLNEIQNPKLKCQMTNKI